MNLPESMKLNEDKIQTLDGDVVYHAVIVDEQTEERNRDVTGCHNLTDYE